MFGNHLKIKKIEGMQIVTCDKNYHIIFKSEPPRLFPYVTKLVLPLTIDVEKTYQAISEKEADKIRKQK